MQITLEDQEVKLIINALYAVSPSGGGSAPFALLRKLACQVQFPEEQDNAGIAHLQCVAAGEIPNDVLRSIIAHKED